MYDYLSHPGSHGLVRRLGGDRRGPSWSCYRRHYRPPLVYLDQELCGHVGNFYRQEECHGRGYLDISSEMVKHICDSCSGDEEMVEATIRDEGNVGSI